MRRFISVPALAVVLLLGCDRDGSQDLTAPESPAINASVQDEIAALGCDAWWVDYSNGPIPVCDPADGICLAQRDAWLAENIHYDGFVVDGTTIHGTDERDVILCHRSGIGTGVQLFGGKGDDTLFGTNWDDELHGGPGCDRIQGRNGNDFIDAGPGNDGPEDQGGCATQEHRTNPSLRLQGGVWGKSGDDEIVGGPGDDWIMGDSGHDVIVGGPGSDVLLGHFGDDELNGGPGTDHLNGGPDFDICQVGRAGEDDTLQECESIPGGKADGFPDAASGQVSIQAGPDLIHISLTAHAATATQPVSGWAAFDGPGLHAAGPVEYFFDHAAFDPVLQNGSELCVCGVMVDVVGPPPPIPPDPSMPTSPDIDEDGIDNEFCLYVMDAEAPGSTSATDLVAIIHEGMPWAMWFDHPYPSPGICAELKSASTGGTLISGDVFIHDYIK